MDILSKSEFLSRKKELIKEIESGAVFIYPTDTIYGLGCLALNKKSVKKIESLKKRKNQPFSILVSKPWIKENCILKKEHKKVFNKLPGPYTLILRLKKGGTIGIRIPKHWFSKIIKETGPIITTSVNISGKPFMTCLEDADKTILKKVDFILYEGKKTGKPSTLIDLTGDKTKITKR
jgi:L-threonylcarbamoyladenylate synthase